jgi:hypothetical protein
MLPLLFDNMWLRINVALWKFSNELDRSGDEGTVAKKFGLFDPADPERPSCMQTALKEIGALLSDLLRLHSDPPPPPSENIPTVESTVAASGHAYVSETRHLRAKEKVKTKGSALRTDLELADEEEEEILPESLPADFKIGKKNIEGQCTRVTYRSSTYSASFRSFAIFFKLLIFPRPRTPKGLGWGKFDGGISSGLVFVLNLFLKLTLHSTFSSL